MSATPPPATRAHGPGEAGDPVAAPAEARAAAPRVRRRYRFRAPFWIYCGLTLLAAVVAMQTGRNLLFWAFGAMTSSLLLSGIVSGAMMTGLRLTRVMPDHGAVGTPMVVRYAVTNRRRLLPAFGIHVVEVAPRPSWRERRAGAGGGDAPGHDGVAVRAWTSFHDASGTPALHLGGDPPPWTRYVEPAPAWVLHVGPTETVHAEAVFVPRARGLVELRRFRAWTVFPFGLIRKAIELDEPRHVLIHPRVHPLRGDVLSSLRNRGTVGSRVSVQPGPGDDFHGLREYRHGDSLRNVAWKRTADRDGLLTIERTRPDPPRVRIVLDLTRPVRSVEPAEAARLEERAIELAASLVHAATGMGYETGLTVYGADQAPIPVRRNERHRDRIMASLAAIDLDAERPARPRPVGSSREAESVAVIVVHPDRVDLSAASPHALHLSARQLDRLVAEPERAEDERADAATGPAGERAA